MAILEVDSHIGIIWTLKQYLCDKFYFLHAQIYILCKKNPVSFWLSIAILRHNDITW